MEGLLSRGATQFKFVDRTFNINLDVSMQVLEFCLRTYRPGRFFHFEMIPDRLPEALRNIIARFPPGALQFEVGVQSFNPEVCEPISRRQDSPGQRTISFSSIARPGCMSMPTSLSACRVSRSTASPRALTVCLHYNPKRSKWAFSNDCVGTPISRHSAEWSMVYNPQPPYEILQNKLIDFQTMQRLRRFARYWDLLGNSGNFVESLPLLWNRGGSPFSLLLALSDWLYEQTGRTDSIALSRLYQLFSQYLTEKAGIDQKIALQTLARDYQRAGRNDLPGFLRQESDPHALDGNVVPSTTPKRQARHLGRKTES